MASIFANALASRSDQARSVDAGMHNTLECKNCGASRDRRAEDELRAPWSDTTAQRAGHGSLRARDASTPLRCHFCKAALV
jgi:hypothetical protein